MSFSGGAVLFKDRNMTEEKKKKALIDILTHPETAISMLRLNTKGENDSDPECATLFKVYVPDKLRNRYFIDIDDPIRQPKVLIIKLLTNPDKEELTNELAIHSTLGSQSTILPFSPSYIFGEEIKSEDTQMTNLGKAFYRLLKTNYKITESFRREHDIISYIDKYIRGLYNIPNKQIKDKKLDEIRLKKIILDELADVLNEIVNHVKYKRPLNIFRVKKIITKIYALIQGFSRQTIIIMEFLECSTLNDFHNIEKEKERERERERETTEPPTHYTLYNTTLESLNLDEVYTFCTYFLASLMAIEGYSHGDLHTSNVMICKTPETSIVPYLIDFGRSTGLSNLQFQELQDLDEYSSTYYLDKVKSLSVQMKNFIKSMYFLAKSNKMTIHTYITDKIAENKYVEAVILISMCKNTTITNSWSMFYETFSPTAYIDNRPVSINYLYLYKITNEQANKYNELITQLIDERTRQTQMLQQNLELQSISEGKSKHSVFNLFGLIKPRSRPEPMHEPMHEPMPEPMPEPTSESPPVPEYNSTQVSIYKSMPTPLSVGGRHIINIIKNKSKKNKKKTRRNKTRRNKSRQNKSRTKK